MAAVQAARVYEVVGVLAQTEWDVESPSVSDPQRLGGAEITNDA